MTHDHIRPSPVASVTTAACVPPFDLPSRRSVSQPVSVTPLKNQSRVRGQPYAAFHRAQDGSLAICPFPGDWSRELARESSVRVRRNESDDPSPWPEWSLRRLTDPRRLKETGRHDEEGAEMRAPATSAHSFGL